MAYGNIYQSTIPSNKGKDWVITIQKDGYGGGVTSPEWAPVPVSVTTQPLDFGQGSIQGSVCVCRLMAETDFQWKEFFTASTGDYRCVVYDNDSAITIFDGFNEGGLYSEPYTGVPYPVELRFVDGLGMLKNYDFDGGTMSTDQMHILEVIRRCTNQLPIQLPINEVFNVYTSAMNSTTSDSAFTQMYVSGGTFIKIDRSKLEQPMNAYEVLERILNDLGCTIFFNDGEWWVYRWPEKGATNQYYRKFPAAVGTETATTVTSSGDAADVVTLGALASGKLTQLAKAGTMRILPKIERFEYRYTPNHFSYVGNDIFKNGEFSYELGINNDNLPRYWAIKGTTTNADFWAIVNSGSPDTFPGRQGGATSRGLRPLPDKQFIDIATTTTQTSFDANKYIQTDVTNLILDDGIIRLDLELSVTGDPVQLRFVLDYTTSGGVTKYLAHTTGGWNAIYTALDIQPSSAAWDGFVTIKFGNPYGAANTTLSTPDKVSAKLRVFKPITLGTSSTVIFKRIKGLYDVDATTSITDGFSYIDETASGKELKTFKIDAYHSDGLDVVSENSLRHSDYSITSAWARRGEVESLNIWEVLDKDYFDRLGDDHKRIGIGTTTYNMTDYPSMLSTIRTTVGATTYDYMVLGLTHNIRDDSMQLELMERRTSGITGTTSNVQTKGGAGVNTSGASHPPSARLGSGDPAVTIPHSNLPL